MKRRVITFIMLVLAIGTLLTGCAREETEVRDFYISEGKTIITQETIYILTSGDLRCKATEPDLIMYCKLSNIKGSQNLYTGFPPLVGVFHNRKIQL